MSNLPNGTFTATLAGLFGKGLRFSTVIDIGCADGNFFLQHFDMGLFPGAVPVNIDANALYEQSLKDMKDVLGGHYVVAAVSDKPGEIEMTTSVHPYWNSVRPPDDPYWERLNKLSQTVAKVPAVTLDNLAQELSLKGPILLKLDVQGAEVQALRGAKKVLSDTDVVIIEADVDDFQAINTTLIEANFSLYDITQLNYAPDRSLGWFYPVYLNRRRDDIRTRAFWDKAVDQQVIDVQAKRRQAILGQNAFMLSKYRAMKPPAR